MRPRKVFYLAIFSAFFVWLHFGLRFWIMTKGDLEYICNSGGPFGLPLPNWFWLIGLGAIIFPVLQWWQEKPFFSQWPWLFIIAGGAGNFLERAYFGCILDYLHLPMLPVFNAADALISVGVIGIIVTHFESEIRHVTIGCKD